jgi:hypothetical protein
MLAETADWRTKEVISLLKRPGVDVAFDTVITRRTLMHARNTQVWHFRDTDCTHLFLLDSDCVPQKNTIVRLLAHNTPIISAPHETTVNGERGLMVVDKAAKGYVQHHPLTGLQGPNVRVGCGGLLIAKEVFETLEAPWFVCQYNERGELALSEDFYFCERALKAGYEIWAQCNLWQRHKSGL